MQGISSEPVIQFVNVTIFQDTIPVLSDVNLRIEKSEFVYLVGKTGSGKSSLLKTIYADLPLQSGIGQVVGFDLNNLKRKKISLLRRQLGIVFQDFQLLTDRTVSDNLIFVMRATGWNDKSKIKNRLMEVMNRVGLAGKEDKMPHQLSGGEQQRVVIARALINEPKIILADEPTGNLDPEVSREIMKLLFDINRMGTALLMATHDYSLITDYPARVVRCEGGRLVEGR
ncbi:MAG: phosphonate ABC transporter ATP-binding protein [Bacteroidetes bacterium RIFCSPLOWO2_02_FULL_36_8]|nr:MAG: phosphonate ABC transporter ATP-binding protein [Bacteroidetes bacterium RIFCSPLOWO2_02_FULL_36_8]OFY69264.1 MAG: phosphonate ABC transporter ATP-binding protein [Bacteroidetes bacterium RIFCSPLOWO2_12_FULL_37_12]